MKLKSLFQFIILFLAMLFMIFVNLSVFWFFVAFILSFILFVYLKHSLREQITKELQEAQK